MRPFSPLLLCLCTVVLVSSFITSKVHYKFPYKQAGLTEKQAAAHLLGRFTFGAKPGQVEEVAKMGLENWFEQQLNAGLPEDSLSEKLSGYDALNLSNAQVVNKYLNGGQITRMAIRDGIVNQDSVKTDRKEYRDKLRAYMEEKGWRPQQELFQQLVAQKILRAVYSRNQMQEVLTDFWFNHFNVALVKNNCAEYIPAYERDVIRPNVTAKFEDLLLATAKSPAMLYYLDNFSSSGVNTDAGLPGNGAGKQRLFQAGRMDSVQRQQLNKLQQARKAQGLNENYAREVMELHTLGVDGGYTQQDVTQAARVLTGWTVYPLSDYAPGSAMKNIINRVGEDKLAERGFVHEGDFLFAINRHDNGPKTVLGRQFSGKEGYQEGVELLRMLAHHPSTAKFISRKLAVRFVSDHPAQSLIDKMAKTFMEKNGDIKQVLITMVCAPEFWKEDALRAKTKSPLEYAISAVRSLDASVSQPVQLFNWINKMGEKLYAYQAPTGYPDSGPYWINTGSLLNRMNFGLALASGRIPGVWFNLAALNGHHEPESAEAALAIYSRLLMPERNVEETVKRLQPLLNHPELNRKVDEAAGKTLPAGNADQMDSEMNSDALMNNVQNEKKQKKDKVGKVGLNKNNKNENLPLLPGNNSMLGQVVGIIIGSPEFQRR